MKRLRSSPHRHVVAVVVMFVLTLAGVGRGLVAAADLGVAGVGVPGVAFHICHSGADDGTVPADPLRHDCCDACALLAPFTVSNSPSLSQPASVAHAVTHAQGMAWSPRMARRRTPRQSQGPPAA